MNQSGSEPMFNSDKTPVVGNNCYDYAFGDNRRYRPWRSEPGRGYKQLLSYVTCGKGHNSLKERILSDNPKHVYALSRGQEDVKCKDKYYKVMAFVAPGSVGDFHFYKQVGSVRYRVQKGDTVKTVARFFRVKPDVIRHAVHSKTKTPTDGMIDDIYNHMTTSRNHKPGTHLVITFPVNLWAHKLGWGTRPLLVDASGRTIVDPRRANRNYELKYKQFCGAYCVKKGGIKTM